MLGTLEALHVTQTQSPEGFYTQKLGELFCLALEPWAGVPGMKLGPLTS